jgi:hypothetical protein
MKTLLPDRKDVGQLSKTLDTWFEGSLLLAPMLFTTKCENIERDVMNKAMSPFVLWRLIFTKIDLNHSLRILNLSPTNAEHSVEATELLAQLKEILQKLTWICLLNLMMERWSKERNMADCFEYA